MERRERILFVELWRLGDAVCATAGLRALRIAKPDAEIAVLAHPQHGDPLLRSTAADRHLRFNAFWTRGQGPKDKYLPWTIDYEEVYRAAREVRSFRPDHVLLFRGDIREQLFFRALGLRNIVDLKGTLPILPGIHTNQRPRGVQRWREYVFHVQQWSKTSVFALPSIDGVVRTSGARSYVLVHPGAGWRYRQWNARSVAALIRWLDGQGVPVRVAAGQSDREFITELHQAYGATLRVQYPSLSELYSLISRARLVVCNNSAALHISEALETPCVAITGPSDPVRWGIYRSHSRTVIRSEELACHPCREKRCVLPDNWPCMERISVHDVIEVLEDLGIGVAVPAALRASRV